MDLRTSPPVAPAPPALRIAVGFGWVVLAGVLAWVAVTTQDRAAYELEFEPRSDAPLPWFVAASVVLAAGPVAAVARIRGRAPVVPAASSPSSSSSRSPRSWR